MLFNMNEYFSLERAADSAALGKYSAGHMLWLFSAVLVCLFLSRLYAGAGERGRRRLRLLVSLSAGAVSCLRTGLLILNGDYSLSRLPLHLCSMAVYICIYHGLSLSRKAGQFLFAFCLPGAVCALLFPDWSSLPGLHYISITSFLLHILPAAYVLMLTAGGDLVPEPSSLPGCCACLALAALPIYAFNKLTGLNFMFLNYPPPGTPLMLFAFLGNPGYLLGYLPMAGLVWALMYGIPKKACPDKKSAD